MTKAELEKAMKVGLDLRDLTETIHGQIALVEAKIEGVADVPG